MHCEEWSIIEEVQAAAISLRSEGKESEKEVHKECEMEKGSYIRKGKLSTMDKEQQRKVIEDDTSSNSSQSLHQVEFNINGDDGNVFSKRGKGSAAAEDDGKMTTTVISLDSLKTMTPEHFGAQFQEAVICLLMQSTGALIGPPTSSESPVKGGPSTAKDVMKENFSSPSTWNEATYNRAATEQNRRPPMTRTSAEEESDSQEEFPIPQNKSPQQRSVRIRRLNRSRSKKAKDLTTNRKAMKKLPYVVHIDGTGRARGIHKHLWQAAVRGQCGRLDPTMDNINHHPKHVVDSIWHALEKEWEFEGFTHRAREMFERFATKFMRNRKMQLKKKCKRDVDGLKPNDVSLVHWTKIVQLTKGASKEGMCTTSIQSTSEAADDILEVLQERNELPLLLQGKEQRMKSKSPTRPSSARDISAADKEDVDVKIWRLRNELFRLQKSRESRQWSMEEKDKGKAAWEEEVDPLSQEVRAISMSYSTKFDEKENMMPDITHGDWSSTLNLKKTTGKGEEHVIPRAFSTPRNTKLQSIVKGRPEISEPQRQDKVAAMECGDMVSLLAISGGREEEIRNAIVMGLAGTKFARKVIPKGWYLVKVNTYTDAGASEVYPFPTGWVEQVKHKTLKDAEGRNILWPDNLLRM